MTWDGRWPICGRPHDLRCEGCNEAARPCYCGGRDDVMSPEVQARLTDETDADACECGHEKLPVGYHLDPCPVKR